MSDTSGVIQQKHWTEDELRAAGFAYYPRKKQVVMVRPVTEVELPLSLNLGTETVELGTNFYLCYLGGNEVKSSLDEYEHWPIQVDIFEETYRPWDEHDRQLTPGEQDLQRRGCQPYFKAVGVWAKHLSEVTRVQSIDSDQVSTATPGNWLAIGAQGEPWIMDDRAFRLRYANEGAETTA